MPIQKLKSVGGGGSRQATPSKSRVPSSVPSAPKRPAPSKPAARNKVAESYSRAYEAKGNQNPPRRSTTGAQSGLSKKPAPKPPAPRRRSR